MAMFCPEHSNCEASISFISNILTNKDPSKFEEISNEFKLLGFDKIKDLANSTFGKVGQINCLGEDPLAKLYEAIEIYDGLIANHLKSAKLEYSQQNFVKTQEICKEMLLHKPNDLELLLLLSASYFYCEEYDICMTYLNEALDKNPDCPELLNNLGLCCSSKSQFTESFKFFSDALHQDITNKDAWINCARLLILANKKQEAVTAYHMVLSFKPNLHTVRNEYAQLLFSLNRMEEAELQYKIATKTAPKYVDTWNNLGNLYMTTNKIKEAINCYVIAAELNHTLKITWNYLGIAYLKLKEYENAIDSFQKALVLCPEDICALKNSALAYYHLQNWPLAVDTLKKVLEFQPDDLDSNLQLGLVYNNFLKNYVEAEKYFKKILDLNPQEEDIHKYLILLYLKQGNHKCASEAAISLGDLLYDQDDYEKAKHAYFWALYLDPNNGISHWKMGNVIYRLGHTDKALIRYKMCLELKPNFANAFSDCGLICEENNLPEKALDYYDAAHMLDPNNLIILQNLTYLQEKLGNFDDVVKLNYKMLKHEDCDHYKVHLELAKFHKIMGNLNDALEHCEMAMELVMTKSEVLYVYQFLGNILLEMKKTEEALLFFNKAIEIDPLCVKALTNIGSIYKDCGKFIEAINSYNIVLNLIPNFPDAYCNLVQCLQHICDWKDYDNRIITLKEIVTKQLNNDQVPSLMPHHSLLYNFPLEIIKKIALKYSEQLIDKVKFYRKLPQSYVHQTILSKGRIRVGYVFSTFSDHPIAHIMKSIPYLHDKNKFEVFWYSLSPYDGILSWSKNYTEADHFKDISGLTVVDAANLINNDGIHILVNINGYTKGSRNEIFALRPAPIQVLWLGYPSTSGAKFIDYLITDKVCSPPEFGHFYSEKLAYLNRSVSIGDHKQIYSDLSCRGFQNKSLFSEENIPLNNENIYFNGNHSNELVSSDNTTVMYCFKTLPDGNLKYFTRQMYNLPEDVVVYCNFSQLYKIDPSTFRMWANILLNVPNSVLWLLQFPFNGEHNLREYAKTLNIDLSRIIFSSVENKEEHMLRIPLADVFLDTPLYNAHTTCLDVLWTGTPVITLPGKTLASRVAASQLTTLGCTETIAENEEDYVKKAIQLGLDKTLLESIRSKIWLLKMESKLFDCKSYTEELEIVYQDMWSNFI